MQRRVFAWLRRMGSFGSKIAGHPLVPKRHAAAPRSGRKVPLNQCVRFFGTHNCLDHHIILNERHLRRVLRASVTYYHSARTHLSLVKQCPQRHPPDSGNVIAFSISADSITSTDARPEDQLSPQILLLCGAPLLFLCLKR